MHIKQLYIIFTLLGFHLLSRFSCEHLCSFYQNVHHLLHLLLLFSLRPFYDCYHGYMDVVRMSSPHRSRISTRFVHMRYRTGVGSGGGGGGGARGACAPPPHFFDWGGNSMFVPPPPLLTPHFYFPLELYVYITLTNNYLAFFIYQLIILWTISIN